MIIEFLLATALDMSLPEFQPNADISGNVIVTSIDDETNETIIEKISLEELPIVNETDTDFQDVILSSVSADDIIIKTPILRSVETHTINASAKSNMRISSGKLAVHSGDTLYYVYLTAGIEYTLSTTSGVYTASSLNKDTVVHSYSNSTFTPENNIYLVKENSSFYVTYTTGEPDNPPDDPSGNDPDDPSGNDPSGTDYTDLINAVNRVNDSVNVCAYVLLFMAFCPFLTKIVDKLMFRKED